MSEKFYIKTYGCQMNTYDSLRMQSIMKIHGYVLVESIIKSDIVILNTCNIREKAVEKVYSELGRIKSAFLSKKKSCIIILAGCIGQAEGKEAFKRAPYIDIIVGPQSYISLPSLLKDYKMGKRHIMDLDFIDYAKFDKLEGEDLCQGISSFISIQEGCDKFCHFCVVPFTRGAEFSRRVEQIYTEADNMVQNGARELVLLGQNVSAYHGKDKNDNEYSLANLIEKLCEIKNLKRIRYTTSHPIDMTDDLVSLHANEPKLMPFLHLPVQSGADNILKQMNRKHTRLEYLDLISKFKFAKPDITFSTDIIVGYPGETCEDFADTIDLINKVSFSQCYYFKYSPRYGTPAALKKQIPEEEKNSRLKILDEVVKKNQMKYHNSFIGKVVDVLIESSGKYSQQVKGRSQYYQPVYFNDVFFPGKIVKATVEIVTQRGLMATKAD